MTTGTYSIDDGNGNQLTTGLQGHNAHAVAQGMANERGEAVYLWEPGEDEATEIEPLTKDDVTSWESVDSYVQTYPSDGEDGACDVAVQVGEAGGRWYLHTSDDAGGSDEADDTSYDSRDAAIAAAEAMVSERTEAEDGEDADDYLRRQTVDRAGEPDAKGEWACYWDTVDFAGHVEERYATQAQAEAAVETANTDLHAANPSGGGTTLLCGYEVRQLVDGEWVAIDEDP